LLALFSLAQVQNPGSKKKQKSKIHIPKSKLQSPNFEIQNSKVQTSKSKIQNPKSQLQSLNLEIQDPESKIKTPKSKPQNPKSRIQNHNSKVQTTKTTQFYGSHGPHVLDELIDLDLMFLWTTSRGLKWKSKGSTSKNKMLTSKHLRGSEIMVHHDVEGFEHGRVGGLK